MKHIKAIWPLNEEGYTTIKVMYILASLKSVMHIESLYITI